MNLQWIENARRVFVRAYGHKRGPAVCAAVVPGVMGDFRRMLERAAVGETVREDYRTDDLKTEIHLEGRRTENGLLLTAMRVGGRSVDLGGEAVQL